VALIVAVLSVSAAAVAGAWIAFGSGHPAPTGHGPTPTPPASGTSGPSPAATCQPATGVFGGFGGCFDPDSNPFRGPGASEVTFAQAQAAADLPIYAPQTTLAEDGTLSHAWIGVDPETPPMLPHHDVTKVALSYESGIQITFVPWQYGPNAPPFSEEQVAEHYRQVAGEAPAGVFTATTIDGIPALEGRENVEATNNPWWVELQLGSTNANAVTVRIVGRRSVADLATVAESIISQWKSAGSGAG